MAVSTDETRKGNSDKGHVKGDEYVRADHAGPEEEHLDLVGCRILDSDRRRHRHQLSFQRLLGGTGAGGNDGSVIPCRRYVNARSSDWAA